MTQTIVKSSQLEHSKGYGPTMKHYVDCAIAHIYSQPQPAQPKRRTVKAKRTAGNRSPPPYNQSNSNSNSNSGGFGSTMSSSQSSMLIRSPSLTPLRQPINNNSGSKPAAVSRSSSDVDIALQVALEASAGGPSSLRRTESGELNAVLELSRQESFLGKHDRDPVIENVLKISKLEHELAEACKKARRS